MSEPHAVDRTAVERSLAALKPSAPGLDRDRILFEAGRAAARGRLWPAATALLALLAAGLGGALVWRTGEAEVRYVLIAAPAAAPARPAVDSPAPRPDSPPVEFVASPDRRRFGSHQLAREALRWGAENLPLSSGAGPVVPGPWDRTGEVSTYLKLRMAIHSGGDL